MLDLRVIAGELEGGVEALHERLRRCSRILQIESKEINLVDVRYINTDAAYRCTIDTVGRAHRCKVSFAEERARVILLLGTQRCELG